MINLKIIARRKALQDWRASFAEWHRHRTDETAAAQEAARQHYLLLV